MGGNSLFVFLKEMNLLFFLKATQLLYRKRETIGSQRETKGNFIPIKKIEQLLKFL
jgi:hypothetical protein